MSKHRILLDVDTGIDDALAIIYLAASTDVELVAAGSVHGNVDARRAALNTLRVIEVCDRDAVPVAQGAAEALAQPLRIASQVHGEDGLGDMEEPAPSGSPTGEQAADQIVRLSLESPGELDLLAVGPLTHLALAVRRDPEALTRFKSITIMGGSGPQNQHWGALAMDANVDHDPEAADLVFAASGNITMVGTNLSPLSSCPRAVWTSSRRRPMRIPSWLGGSRGSMRTSTNAGRGAAESSCGIRWRQLCCSIRL